MSKKATKNMKKVTNMSRKGDKKRQNLKKTTKMSNVKMSAEIYLLIDQLIDRKLIARPKTESADLFTVYSFQRQKPPRKKSVKNSERSYKKLKTAKNPKATKTLGRKATKKFKQAIKCRK